MTTLRVREAARVITLDANDRILLLKYEDHSQVFWATPGGSLEPGEDHESAARRELDEELGITNLQMGPQLAERSAEHQIGTEVVRQVERYYIARIADSDLNPEDATQPDTITEHRWWPLDELRHSSDTIYPKGLADLVDAYLADGAPEEPTAIL